VHSLFALKKLFNDEYEYCGSTHVTIWQNNIAAQLSVQSQSSISLNRNKYIESHFISELLHADCLIEQRYLYHQNRLGFLRFVNFNGWNIINYYYGSKALLLDLGRFFSFFILHTVGRTPWTGDQPVAMPLPTHRINAHNTDIHALSRIRTHDHSGRAGEYRSCVRPRGHFYRRNIINSNVKKRGFDQVCPG
jgi:hypothetical protein